MRVTAILGGGEILKRSIPTTYAVPHKPRSAGHCFGDGGTTKVAVPLSCTKIERVLLRQNPSVLWPKPCHGPVGTALQSLDFLRQLRCGNVIPTPKSPKERRKRSGYDPVKMSPLRAFEGWSGSEKDAALFSCFFSHPQLPPANRAQKS